MELKPGYKQTEIGVIPNDWEVVPLGKLNPFVTSGSRGWADYYSDYGDLFVRITNLTRDSIYLDLENCKYVEIPEGDSEGTRTQLRDKDLLISITADIGIIGYVDASVPSPAYINQHIALVRLDENKVNSNFVSYFLASAKSQRIFRASTDVGAKAGMSLGGVQKTLTALPSLPEQSVIAATLGDVDTLLSALDAHIAKQRDLKTAAMQQLLTGKTRLPGFGGKWEVKRLGEVLAVRHGKNQKEVEADDGEFPILATGGQIGWAKQWLYNKASVLIGRKGTIDRPQYMETPFWTVDTLFFTELKGENVAKFFFYRFGLIDWMQYNEASGVPSLNARTIENIEIAFPHPEEQTAIAEVLSDMDDQLVALKQQREKTALLKQGMMQELLTGRTRLVKPVAQPTSNVVPFPKQEVKPAGRKANVHFQRSVFAAEIVDRLYAEPTFGHVKFQKLIYLAERVCKVDIGANYHRDAAGPYDNRALRSIDSQLKKSKWFEAKKINGRYQYIPLEKHGDHKPYFDRYFSNMRDTFDKVIDTFKLLDTERCEIVATLYEAWHDLLLKNFTATDDAIVDQVLNHWHDAKKRIPKDRWHKALGWMRENGFVPG